MKPFLYLLSLLLFTNISHAQHQINYQVSPLGNLVYQLDCISQPSRFHCSQNDFTNLWRDELLKGHDQAIDQQMFDQWKSIRSKLDQTIEFEPLPDVPMMTSPNYPVNSENTLNVLEQIRIMAFAAEDFSQYRKLAGFVLSQKHLSHEQAIIEYFWPRFDKWFIQQQTGLIQFAKEAMVLSEQHQVNELLTQIRYFYDSELPDNMVLPVYLVAHPEKQAQTSGLVFNESSIIEVLKGEQAQKRLGVVIHEITHFYHERAGFEWHLKNMAFFTRANSKSGKVAYYLFNEAMAAAIGNGILEQRINSTEYFKKYFEYPMSFYADQGIDKAAKIAMPLVKSYLDDNKAIDEHFLSQLDHLWSTELKELLNEPKQRLRHVSLLTLDDQLKDSINDVFAVIQPSSAQINTGADLTKPNELVLNKYKSLDAIILATEWQQLKPLKLKGLDFDDQKTESTQIISNEFGAARVIIVSQSRDYITQQLNQILSKQRLIP